MSLPWYCAGVIVCPILRSVVSIYSSCEVVLILSDLEEFFSILMSDFREALWKNKADLKEALLKYVREGLQRWEMLDFLTRDFPFYAWSVMLDRRLRHFDIFFSDGAVKVNNGIWNWTKRDWKAIAIPRNVKKNKAIVLQVVPDGIPDHIYNFPEQYDLEDCGRWYTLVYVKKKKKCLGDPQ